MLFCNVNCTLINLCQCTQETTRLLHDIVEVANRATSQHKTRLMRLLLECDVIERIQRMWRCHLSAQLLQQQPDIDTVTNIDTDIDTDTVTNIDTDIDTVSASDSDLMMMLHASINVRDTSLYMPCTIHSFIHIRLLKLDRTQANSYNNQN